jgi:outer membrane receptor protein involved in Fe transport
LQPRLVYFYQNEAGRLPNKSLGFTRSWQTVAGFNWKFAKSFRLKTEIYYQYLYNVPVIENIPQQSILNFGDDFYNDWDYSFVNKGTGQNYGIELTLEKFMDKHYYFLITASLYQSKYKGFDKIERNTAFNGNYALCVLGGYEWKIGKNILLSANTRVSYYGGKRYIPMKVISNGFENMIDYDYSQTFTKRLPDYFRLDLNVNMKMNFRKWALEFFMEVTNITNRKNVHYQYYNVNKQEEVYIYQYGLMPMGGVKVYF